MNLNAFNGIIPLRKVYEVVGYSYNAALHCKDCALATFGLDLDKSETRDSEGNPIAPVFLGDVTMADYCDDCLLPLDED